MVETEWCDEHNIEKEKEYTDEGIIHHCPKCEWLRHQAYLKKWEEHSKKGKREKIKSWFKW